MSEYRDHAYERTIVSWLQRVMLDRVISSDSPPKEGIVCDEVFRSESDITQEALMKVYDKLGLWENDQRTRMNAFKWMHEAAPLPFLNKEDLTKPTAEAKKKNESAKKSPRKRKKGSSEGSGGAGTE